MAQSTVRLIVDAQNAITPLKRVNDQTKKLSQTTDKLKGRLDKSNRSLRDTGRSAKAASGGVKGLLGALKPLLAALAVVGTARFIFVKTAELETQRKSLEVLTGSLEKTNKIIKELQDFGAVTPFTSSELIEQTKRLKAFGFQTEELVDTTKRLSDVAGATGADLTGIATAFGQIRAKGKLQQEENLQLLERGVDITTELKKITGLQGEEFESAMRKGKIGADLVTKALINLTDKGGAFAGGATAQADTLNGKLSTLQDTIDTLARTIGEELSDEIKGVIDIAIAGVKEINKLIERIGTANKVGRINLANITMESRKEAREQLRKEKGSFFAGANPFGKDKKREQELFEEIKARKIKNALELKNAETLKEINKAQKETNKIVNDAKEKAKQIKESTEKTTTAIESSVTFNELFNTGLEQTNFLVDGLSLGTDKFADKLLNVKSETDKLNEKFMEIGQEIEQSIVSNLTDAVNGTKTLGEAAIGVLNQLKQKLIEVALQQATAGLGNKIGGFLGNIFGGDKSKNSGLFGLSDIFSKNNTNFPDAVNVPFGSVDLGLGSILNFATGGRPPVNKASLVGERGPELFVPNSAGTIIPNNKLGSGDSITNIVNVSVDASGSSVEGDDALSQQLGQTIALVVQETLVREKRNGGLLA